MCFGIVVFPGTWSDTDCQHALKNVLGQEAEYLWHKDQDFSSFDCIILPGGFSYGDYLRAGAIARFSPIMPAVERFARAGGLVLGICNGFQMLCEAGLLPGALMRNAHLQFRCQWTHLRVERSGTPFTQGCQVGQVLRIPFPMARGITTPTTIPWTGWRLTARLPFATATLQGKSRTNPILTALYATLLESQTGVGTSWE